jgi:cation transport ATPase
MARRADGVSVPTSALVPGEVVEVRADEVLPCDGVVVECDVRRATDATATALQHSNIPTFGISSAVIDQAVLTGESRPITIDAGGLVHAGTTCRSPSVRVRVTAIGDATRVGALLASIAADSGRPMRTTAWLDRLVAWWAPLTVMLAGSAWLAWAWHGQAARGLDQAVALILVACPCALGLAAPLTQAVAVSRAARRGLLVRDAGALDALAGGTLAHAVFDKTGTLTEGRMRVVGWDWLTDDAEMRAVLPGIVAAAEDRSQHPVALAISAHLTCERAAISDWQEIPGRGVRCRAACDGVAQWDILIGRFATGPTSVAPDHADTLVTVSVRRITDTSIVTTHDDPAHPAAVIRLADPLRPGIAAVLDRLRHHGVRLHLASGDTPAVALAVGRQLGFAPDDIHGGLLPEDKAALVQRLAADGPVAMAGDGLNDAAAMAHADASIALSGGIEHALGACRIVVARSDADTALGELLDLADGVRQRIRLVLSVSLAYNLIGVGLAAAGVWGPYLCAIAMPVSSLTAVLLAVMRMRKNS